MPGQPPECEWSVRARHCWQWCGKAWRPDLWPVYAALHPVDDWAMLSELMQEIRDHG